MDRLDGEGSGIWRGQGAENGLDGVDRYLLKLMGSRLSDGLMLDSLREWLYIQSTYSAWSIDIQALAKWSLTGTNRPSHGIDL